MHARSVILGVMAIDRHLARLTMLLPDAGIRGYGRVHSRVFRATRGRVGRRWAGRPVLLLTTTGRRSGEPRSTMVLFGRDGDRYVVIGSNTGSDRAPAWALNLLADPAAAVMVGGSQFPVRASVLEGDERERVWRSMTERYAGFDRYRERTSRDIKVFVLSPA